MSSLLVTPASGIQRTAGFTIFYYGVAPDELHKLPAGHEFTCVYSPNTAHGWRAVRFRVSGQGGYEAAATRDLTPEEINHFEGLLISTMIGLTQVA